MFVCAVVNGIVKVMKLREPKRAEKRMKRERFESNLMFLEYVYRKALKIIMLLHLFGSKHEAHTAEGISTFTRSRSHSRSLSGLFIFPWIINCVSTVPNSDIVAHRLDPSVEKEIFGEEIKSKIVTQFSFLIRFMLIRNWVTEQKSTKANCCLSGDYQAMCQ